MTFVKFWMAAAYASVAIVYAIHAVEVVKETVSAYHRDGSGDAEQK
jgi:hypothetical protein